MVQLFVITSLPDPHVDMVVNQLTGWEVVTFDPAKYPFQDLTFGINESAHFLVDDGAVCQPNVVWFRKPRLLRSDQMPVAKKYRRYTHDAYRRFVQTAYGIFQNSYWVSDPWNIQKAENKVRQLELAKEKGLAIPRTLVTSDANIADGFRKMVGQVIVKPLGSEFVMEGDQAYAFYTTAIDPSEEFDYTGLTLAPAIFQERLSGCVDVRVTVVGSQIFACKIQKRGKTTEVDWRRLIDGQDLEYVPHQIPDQICCACIEMVKAMGLRFGAFDFMWDGNQYWFLEINPNGQWAFVEIESGLPIAKAFVELFEKRDF